PIYRMTDPAREADEVGAATGLAWTPYGGEVLEIEAQWMAGRGSLILTGQLGDVMKESAMTALSYARARASGLGLKEGCYAERADGGVRAHDGGRARRCAAAEPEGAPGDAAAEAGGALGEEAGAGEEAARGTAMAQVDFQHREIAIKLVYYGPALSGKTTNLE